MRTVVFTWPVCATAFYAALQTTSGAGALLLSGTGATKNEFFPTAAINAPGNFERTVSLTSTGNLSAITFTIVGKDQLGNTVTETLAGPNNNTVYSVNFYAVVTSISTDAAVATAVSAGTGTTGRSFWFIANKHVTPFNVGIQVSVLAATVNYTIQNTDVDLTIPLTAQPASTQIVNSTDTNVVGATTTQVSNYMFPTAAIRCLINSGNTTGNLIATFTQAGIA